MTKLFVQGIVNLTKYGDIRMVNFQIENIFSGKFLNPKFTISEINPQSASFFFKSSSRNWDMRLEYFKARLRQVENPSIFLDLLRLDHDLKKENVVNKGKNDDGGSLFFGKENIIIFSKIILLKIFSIQNKILHNLMFVESRNFYRIFFFLANF